MAGEADLATLLKRAGDADLPSWPVNRATCGGTGESVLSVRAGETGFDGPVVRRNLSSS